MKKLLKQIACMLTAVLVTATSVPVYAAPQATSPIINIDGTLAVPPVFLVSQYAKLNPETAKIFNNNPQLMYNYYMHTGIYQGQRCFDTKTTTTVENLFLYMSMNRQTYIKNAQKKSFKYFNLSNYMSQNPELAIAFANNKILWMYHYINFGIYEGRSCGTNSDPAKVIALNPALAVLNNPTFSPDKIMANYATITGSTDTTMLANVYNANGDLAKVLALNNVNLNPAATASSGGSSSSSSSCDHKFEYVSIDGEGKHKKVCEKCGYVDKEENHSYKVDSQTDGNNNTVHVLKCEKCNHKHRENHVDKNYDDICDVCGYKMDHIHHFVMVTPVVKNSTSHLAECKGCGDVIYTPHVFKYTASVTPTKDSHTVMCECGYSKEEAHTYVNGKCKVCGYSVPEHEHTVTYTQNSDGITHNGHCTYEGCPYAVTKEACVYDSTGHCEKCHRACAHAETKIEHIDGTTQHQTVCIICGKVLDTADCQYDEAHKCAICEIECPHPAAQCEFTAIDSTGHSVKCKACGADVAAKEAHNVVYQDTKDGLTHKATCKDCGFVVISSEEHNFEYKYAGNNKHKYMCKDCGYIKTAEEECSYDPDTGSCEYCGHSCTHEGELEYIDNGDGTHAVTCKKCLKELEPEAHTLTYTFEDEHNHTAKCSKCDYIQDEIPHASFEYISNNNGTHKKICKDCRGVINSKEACTFENGKCAICGYVCDHNHDKEYVDNNDGTHTIKCKVCGTTDSTEDHLYRYEYVDATNHKKYCGKCNYEETLPHSEFRYDTNNDGTHNKVCKDCGRRIEENLPCVYDSDGKCTICEYQCPHTNTHVANIDNPEYHNIVCDKCGKITGTESHTGEYTITETAHKKVCSCGYEIVPETEHTLNYVYDTEAGEGIHKHTVNCSVCGYNLAGGEDCVFGSNWVFDEAAYASDGTLRHIKECSKCHVILRQDCSPKEAGDTCGACGHVVATPKYRNYYSLNGSITAIAPDTVSATAIEPKELDSHLTYISGNKEIEKTDTRVTGIAYTKYTGDDKTWYTESTDIPYSRTFTIAYKDVFEGKTAQQTISEENLVSGAPIKVSSTNCASEEAAKNIAKNYGLVFVRYQEGEGAFFKLNHGNPKNAIGLYPGSILELNTDNTAP